MFQGGQKRGSPSVPESPSANECEWDEERGKDADLVAVCVCLLLKQARRRSARQKNRGPRPFNTDRLIPPLAESNKVGFTH